MTHQTTTEVLDGLVADGIFRSWQPANLRAELNIEHGSLRVSDASQPAAPSVLYQTFEPGLVGLDAAEQALEDAGYSFTGWDAVRTDDVYVAFPTKYVARNLTVTS